MSTNEERFVVTKKSRLFTDSNGCVYYTNDATLVDPVNGLIAIKGGSKEREGSNMLTGREYMSAASMWSRHGFYSVSDCYAMAAVAAKRFERDGNPQDQILAQEWREKAAEAYYHDRKAQKSICAPA